MRSNSAKLASAPVFLATTVTLTLLLSGCGGAGVGTGLNSNSLGGGTNAPGRATADATTGQMGTGVAEPATRLGVFVTASSAAGSPNSGKFDHLWATILKVELLEGGSIKAGDKPTDKLSDKTTQPTEKATVIYDGGTEGTTLDLASLSGDAQSRKFALLTSVGVAGGSPTARVRVTLGKSLAVFAPGSPVAQMVTLSSTLGSDSEGRPVISFPLSKPRDLGTGKADLAIDFDLGKLTLEDSKAVPDLRENEGVGLSNPGRQIAATLEGTVGNVKAGSSHADNTFTLTLSSGKSVVVQTGAASAVFNTTSEPSPALTDGKHVRVSGILARDTKRVLASEVALLPVEAAADSSTVRGTVSNANAGTGTFTLSALQVSGLVPSQSTLNVTVASDAALRGRGGLPMASEAFYTALTSAQSVEIEGVYEPVGGTFKATRARLVGSANDSASHEAAVQGLPASVDAKAGTLKLALPLSQWDGILVPAAPATPPETDPKKKSKKTASPSLAVNTNVATDFRNEKGDRLPTAQFFEALEKEGKAVLVTGVYGIDGTVTATRAELRAPAPAVAKTEPAAALATTEAKTATTTAATTAEKPAEKTPGATPEEKAPAAPNP